MVAAGSLVEFGDKIVSVGPTHLNKGEGMTFDTLLFFVLHIGETLVEFFVTHSYLI